MRATRFWSLVLAWWIVTTNGQVVGGPFATFNECRRVLTTLPGFYYCEIRY